VKSHEIIPARLKEAREARALSMSDLAERIDVTRQAISQFEKGVARPSVGTLYAMSQDLDIPIDYFYSEKREPTTAQGAIFFRSKKSVLKKVKLSCHYRIEWLNKIIEYLGRYVDFPEKDLPISKIPNYNELSNSDVEELASHLREYWKLGEAPIDDLVGVLENAGVIVAEFPTSKACTFQGVDALSQWYEGTPYIMLKDNVKSAVRVRFSILHELAHLLLHHSISEEEAQKPSIVDKADEQADRFAAAFLLPATTFPNDIRGSSLDALLLVKEKWGVALSTIIRRCRDLKLLSENQINYLNRQMTIKKYWRNEPLDDVLKVKGPELLRDAVMLLLDNNIVSIDRFVTALGLSAKEVASFCGLPIDMFQAELQREKVKLRLVTPAES